MILYRRVIRMPRRARIKGINTTYHVIIRGNERKNIFGVDSDKVYFIETLNKMKERYNFIIEVYCLMDNHVHILIDDNGNDISKLMKSINISYAYYYNKVNTRVGHLFQDRFISEIIEDDAYLLTVSAYIHNNPVRAGIVRKPEEYKWSSMGAYLGREDILRVNKERILGQFSERKETAIKKYYEFVRKHENIEEQVMEVEEERLENRRRSAGYIENIEMGRKRLEEELERREIGVAEMKKDKELRRELMEMLRKNSSLKLTEIGNLCGGFAESTVSLILKGVK
jgi:REP element-mobilizing transposase RayT